MSWVMWALDYQIYALAAIDAEGIIFQAQLKRTNELVPFSIVKKIIDELRWYEHVPPPDCYQQKTISKEPQGGPLLESFWIAEVLLPAKVPRRVSQSCSLCDNIGSENCTREKKWQTKGQPRCMHYDVGTQLSKGLSPIALSTTEHSV
jgi:hypothetical protein